MESNTDFNKRPHQEEMGLLFDEAQRQVWPVLASVRNHPPRNSMQPAEVAGQAAQIRSENLAPLLAKFLCDAWPVSRLGGEKFVVRLRQQALHEAVLTQ